MIPTLSRVCAGFLFMLMGSVAQAQSCLDPSTVRVAVIPQMQNLTASGRYDPLMQVLGDELKRSVVLVPVGSYGAVIEGLLDSSIDLAEMGPGSYALARDRGADIVAFAAMYRGRNEGRPGAYRSVLVTQRGAGFETLEQLRGAALSLVDPASTSGALVPRVAVQSLTNMPLEAWFGRVSYAGSHDQAIRAVLSGRVDAAFVSDGNLRDALMDGRPVADTLHIIWRSEPIPSDPFVYQQRLCESLKQKVRHVFFQRQTELQSLLDWRGMQGFVPVTDHDYRHLTFSPTGPR